MSDTGNVTERDWRADLCGCGHWRWCHPWPELGCFYGAMAEHRHRRCECPGFATREEGSPAAYAAAQAAWTITVLQGEILDTREIIRDYRRTLTPAPPRPTCPHGLPARRRCGDCRRERERSPSYREHARERMRRFRSRG